MERFIDKKLIVWKNSNRRKPLILRGARQVGKTWSIEKLGRTHFETTVKIDLERNANLHNVFNIDLDAKRICSELEILLGQSIIPGKTLLFFDEIQACPNAIKALRYFYEEYPQLHVIAAGSLLEFALEDISVPVGRIQFMTLHPLSFPEYLLAIDKENAFKVVMSQPKRVSQTLHDYLNTELKRYFFLGGMPECIKIFRQTGSLHEAFDVQRQICETYEVDFSKYKPKVNHHCLKSVWASVARNVGLQTKYTSLADGFSSPTIKKAYNLLQLANVIKKIQSVNPAGLPLGATASTKIFKSIMVDIGLMRHLSQMPVNIEYNKDLLDVYRGAMAEQFVGQEMIISQDNSLYYWNRQAKSSLAEVDYLAVVNNNIYPVEVKSGATGRLKSLQVCLNMYSNCPKGLVLSARPFEEVPNKRITYIPLYYTYSTTSMHGNH